MLFAQLIVLIFSSGLAYFSLRMIIAPDKFASGFRGFADWKYFHPFEISSRCIFAIGFYFSHQTSAYPNIYLILSGILAFTTFFLLIIGKQRHQNFAYRAAVKSPPFLRPSGGLGLIFAIFLIYTLFLVSPQTR